MQVKDVMTAQPSSVTVDTPLKEVASAIEADRLGAVPVVDHRRPVGIVSERDLLVKVDHEGGGWRRLWRRGRRGHGVRAGDVMTSPAVSVSPEATVSEAAHRMLERNLKQLPVVDEGGRLVGMVTRGEVLSVLLRPDAEIASEVRERVLGRALLVPPGHVSVVVDEGVVTLAGQLERKSQIEPLERAVAAVDGVVDVVASLDYRFDDTAPPIGQWWEIA